MSLLTWHQRMMTPPYKRVMAASCVLLEHIYRLCRIKSAQVDLEKKKKEDDEIKHECPEYQSEIQHHIHKSRI